MLKWFSNLLAQRLLPEDWLPVIYGSLLVISGVFCLFYWGRKRFWLPAYVHLMAAGAFILGVWMMAMVPESAPVKQSPLSCVFFYFLCPAIVYFFFVFYGGQLESYTRKLESQKVCFQCNRQIGATDPPVGVRSKRQGEIHRFCPHCGVALK